MCKKCLVSWKQQKASKTPEAYILIFLAFANETAEELKLDIRFQLEFDDFPGFESLKAYISSIFNQLQTKNTTYSFIIAKCIKFIEENYMTNISLSESGGLYS